MHCNIEPSVDHVLTPKSLTGVPSTTPGPTRSYAATHPATMSRWQDNTTSGTTARCKSRPDRDCLPCYLGYMKLLTVTRGPSPAFEGAVPNMDELALHRAQARPAILRIGRRT